MSLIQRKQITAFNFIKWSVVITIFIGTLTACTNPSSPAGFEGYVYEQPRLLGKGGFQGTINGPGNFGVSPWRNEIINIDIRPKTYTETFNILAKDDLNISFRFHAVLKVKPGNIQQIVEKLGAENWYERLVREPFRTFARDAVQQYDSTALKNNRKQVSNQVKNRLVDYLKDTPFELVSVVVGNIDYPDIVAKAVEKKLAAQQLLAEKETQKLIAQKDAEITIEEAKGIAQAQKIINSTLTSNYLQHEAIEAQLKMADSPNHTTVYIPSGNNGIPLLMQQAR